MEYCYFGVFGFQVSRIGLGTIPFDAVLDEKASRNMVDMFYDAGGNYLDTTSGTCSATTTARFMADCDKQ